MPVIVENIEQDFMQIVLGKIEFLGMIQDYLFLFYRPILFPNKLYLAC